MRKEIKENIGAQKDGLLDRTKYLWENLHLTLKPDWRVFRFDYMAEYANHYGSPLDFMGFKFYCNKTTLRKSILKKLRRKSIKIKKKGATVHSSRQMLSYMGYISHSATYDYYKDYVKDNINVRKMKKKVSNHQRRLNQDVRDENCRVV